VLETDTSLQILAAASRSFRVRLPDGTVGYIGAMQVESEERPLEDRVLASATPVRREPRDGAPPMGIRPSGEELTVLGRFGSYVRVSTADGRSGWIVDR
jgi:hypothetical protein